MINFDSVTAQDLKKHIPNGLKLLSTSTEY